MTRIITSLLVCTLLSGIATATTWRQLDLSGMMAAAEIAVHAEVDAVTVEVTDGEPWTDVTFIVTTGLAWPEEEDDPEAQWQDPARITLSFLGGSSGSVTLNADQVPSFTPGDEVVLFAYADRYYSPIVGFNQAVWWLTDGAWHDRNGVILDLDEAGDLTLADGGIGADATDVVAALQAVMEER